MAYCKGQIEIESEDPYDFDGKGKKVIQLPHSCDNWIIGGIKEAKQMIEDLQQAINKLI